MPKPKSKSSKGLINNAKFKFDKTLLAVIAAVVVAVAGYIYYQGSHAATAPFNTLAAKYSCPLTNGVPPTVKYGGTNKAGCVKLAQYIVRIWSGQKISASGVITGTFDTTTKTAVINWQKIQGISADGIVGTQTWFTMAVATNTVPITHGYALNQSGSLISPTTNTAVAKYDMYICKAPSGSNWVVKALVYTTKNYNVKADVWSLDGTSAGDHYTYLSAEPYYYQSVPRALNGNYTVYLDPDLNYGNYFKEIISNGGAAVQNISSLQNC